MLKELREKRAKLVAELRGIVDVAEAADRDLTAEEQVTFDEKKVEKDALDKRIERLEGVEASEAVLDSVVPAQSRRAAIERPAGPEPRREFSSLGEFMHAVRFRPNDQRLEFIEADALGEDGELHAEMRMDDGPSGGFMIPPQFRDQMMQVQPQDALVRPRAEVLPAGSPPDAGLSLPALDQTGDAPQGMFGGVQMQWIEEGADKPATDAKVREVTLTPHEIAGTITVTDKLLRNWQAADATLRTLMRGAVSASEDYAFLRGDGNKKPLGVINAGAAYKVNRGTADKVGYTDLVTMLSRLLMRGGSPIWSMPQSVLPQIMLLKDDAGRLIWQPNAQQGAAGTLLGYPVRWNNRAPLLGSMGDVVLADWSAYLIKDGSGPFVAASEHVYFKQNKTVIKIFWNTDGAPWLTAPIKEENGYEVSPFVILDVPA